MRICQIVDGLAMARHLFERIPEPCLLLTRQADAYPPLPGHVQLVPLRLSTSTTPPALRRRIFARQAVGLLATLQLQAVLTGRTLAQHAYGLATALRAMRHFRPDVVVCHQLKLLPYGIAAQRLFGCRLVSYVHGIAEIEALKTLPVLSALLRRADRAVALSAPMARRLREVVPADRVWVTSMGVDPAVFTNRGQPRRRQIVCVAHFKWMKGHTYLLEAAARVFARMPDHRLVLVGDGEERPRIVEHIARLGLGEHVVLAGRLSGPQIVDVLNESRLFVLPSTSEGLPRALLEAIACGTPAVVTDACNADGIIDSTGLTVPARDPLALAEAMTTALTHTSLWQRCSDNGPGVAARYDWAIVAARDYAMLRMLCSGSGRRISPVGQIAA
jgi:glycosyltransferase involved in cell wall biosynthesis